MNVILNAALITDKFKINDFYYVCNLQNERYKLLIRMLIQIINIRANDTLVCTYIHM